MPCVLKNLTDRPVLLTLSTGEALRLSPGESSSVLDDVEIANNPKVEKLQAQHIIAVDDSRRPVREAARKGTASEGRPYDDEAAKEGEAPAARETPQGGTSTS